MEELKIKQEKQVVQNGFVSYTQNVAELAAQGYVVDVRNKTAPQFMLGLFTCNMLLLDDTVAEEQTVAKEATNVANPATQQPKQMGRPSKKDKIKAELAKKLPAEALAKQ